MIEGLVFPVTELVAISILTESLVQVLKGVSSKELSVQGKQVLSMAMAVLFCTLLKVGVFTDVPQTTVWFGYVLAGIIASRGSNFIHDLVGSIGAISTKKN